MFAHDRLPAPRTRFSLRYPRAGRTFHPGFWLINVQRRLGGDSPHRVAERRYRQEGGSIAICQTIVCAVGAASTPCYRLPISGESFIGDLLEGQLDYSGRKLRTCLTALSRACLRPESMPPVAAALFFCSRLPLS